MQTPLPGPKAPYNDADVPSRPRDSERIPILGTLQGEVKVYQPMTVNQVSLGGMQVETAFPFTSTRCTSSA